MQDLEFLMKLAFKATEEREGGEEAWWYLSFADSVFHGAIVVLAHGPVTARIRVGDLGLAPKGEMLAVRIEEGLLPAVGFRERLLDKYELNAAFAESGGAVKLSTGEAVEAVPNA
jgi:hypothetical protein